MDGIPTKFIKNGSTSKTYFTLCKTCNILKNSLEIFDKNCYKCHSYGKRCIQCERCIITDSTQSKCNSCMNKKTKKKHYIILSITWILIILKQVMWIIY